MISLESLFIVIRLTSIILYFLSSLYASHANTWIFSEIQFWQNSNPKYKGFASLARTRQQQHHFEVVQVHGPFFPSQFDMRKKKRRANIFCWKIIDSSIKITLITCPETFIRNEHDWMRMEMNDMHIDRWIFFPFSSNYTYERNDEKKNENEKHTK